jgi:hypothetical protein
LSFPESYVCLQYLYNEAKKREQRGSRLIDVQTVSIAIASASITLAAIYYIFQIRHQTRIRQTDLVIRLYSAVSSKEFLARASTSYPIFFLRPLAKMRARALDMVGRSSPLSSSREMPRFLALSIVHPSLSRGVSEI